METIDKQIKLRINAEIAKNRSNYALFNEGMKKGADIALSQIQRASRWIPVSERLPEIGMKVIVKTSKGNYCISEMYIPKDCNGIVLGSKEWKGSHSFKTSVTHWKSIE